MDQPRNLEDTYAKMERLGVEADDNVITNKDRKELTFFASSHI